MGINSHSGFAPRNVADNIGCFATNAGQFFKRILIVGDDPAMFFNKNACSSHDILGLAAIEPNGFDVFDQGFFAKVKHVLRGFDDLEQLFGGLVDTNICCLR
eukprot:NODE_2946_length_966_cov_1.619785_g2926_i0.p2 GENE.NODE_2946_length_966_cov_1.619785_g2926_i0~~NODE_2946_length_966_cov_1.619785_g2926_i0.p2  ORF type:complete len:102 (+),score=22.59 NODE_2946_length_966_cov_1.619785_g2926_i0:512-817(+)